MEFEKFEKFEKINYHFANFLLIFSSLYKCGTKIMLFYQIDLSIFNNTEKLRKKNKKKIRKNYGINRLGLKSYTQQL